MTDNKRYKLLKPTPELKIGDEFIYTMSNGSYAYFKDGNPNSKHWYFVENVENNSEWFELISIPSKEPEIGWFSPVEAYNEGFVMGVKHCEKYGTPNQKTDTVVEDNGGLPLPNDFYSGNIAMVDADGNKKPLSDLYHIKYTQSEVDAMMEANKPFWTDELVKEYGREFGYAGEPDIEQFKKDHTPTSTSAEWEILSYEFDNRIQIPNAEPYITFSNNFKDKQYSISRVKRISDGEVFSIGDKVRMIHLDFEIGKIDLVEIGGKNEIRITAKRTSGYTPPYVWLNPKMYCEEDAAQLIKLPLPKPTNVQPKKEWIQSDNLDNIYTDKTVTNNDDVACLSINGLKEYQRSNGFNCVDFFGERIINIQEIVKEKLKH